MRDSIAAASALALAACSAQAEPPPVVPNPSLEGHVLFVTNKGEDTLAQVDLGTGAEVKRVDSCANPHELALSPDGSHLAVGCYGGTTVDIFEVSSLEKIKSIDLGADAEPHGIIWHINGAIYVTAEGRQSVFRITDVLAEKPVLDEFKTGREGSHMLAVSPETNTIWTTDLTSKTVTRVNIADPTDRQSEEIGEEPEGIAVTQDGEALWVSARGTNRAYELDPATLEVRRELDTGGYPLRLAIRPQGDIAITSDLLEGGLSVIDLETGKRIRTITVSSKEEAEKRFQVTVIWSADGSRIYAAETGTNTVAEIDYESGTVNRRFAVGTRGDGLAVLEPQAAQPEEAVDSE